MDGRWGQQKNLYFGCYLSKSKEFFYREMAILFFVKRDPGPPFTTLFKAIAGEQRSQWTS